MRLMHEFSKSCHMHSFLKISPLKDPKRNPGKNLKIKKNEKNVTIPKLKQLNINTATTSKELNSKKLGQLDKNGYLYASFCRKHFCKEQKSFTERSA